MTKPMTPIEACYLTLALGAPPMYREVDDGVVQFRTFQSKGIRPDKQHHTYVNLEIGKKRRDIMVSEIRDDYENQLGTGHWVGLAGFVDDWNPHLWMIPLLLPWHGKAQELKGVWYDS